MKTMNGDISKAVLHIKGLSVASHGIGLLHGLDFHLHAGELAAVAGPSGCGKTSLLRTLSGLIDPIAGAFFFKGSTPETIGWPRYRRSAIFVEQRPVLFDLSVQENIARPFRYHAVNRAFESEKAEQLLEALGVGAHRMNQPARSLSVGQQLRVCLVRALLLEPELLLLDEPTSALDAHAVEKVAELLHAESATRGMAALVATHDRAMAEDFGFQMVDLAPYMTVQCQKEQHDE